MVRKLIFLFAALIFFVCCTTQLIPKEQEKISMSMSSQPYLYVLLLYYLNLFCHMWIKVLVTYPTVISNMLLPTELETAMSPRPLRATITLVIRSGMDVPAARIVRPIISSEMPMVSPTFEEKSKIPLWWILHYEYFTILYFILILHSIESFTDIPV